MPWTVNDPPPPAKNWSDDEKLVCVKAANKAHLNGKTDEEAVQACIAAAKSFAGSRIDKAKKYRVNNDEVTLEDLAKAWLSKADRFTSVPWSSPVSDLSADDYAKVCLIDLNTPGEDKTKANCRLPVRSRPGGPININALRNAASRIFQMKNVPPEAKKKAAKTLVRLMQDAGIEVGSEDLLNLAGVQKSNWHVEVEIAKAEKQLVYGVVLKPDQFDSQGDRVGIEEIEKAAHTYMLQSQGYDYQHLHPIEFEKIRVVESYVTPADFELNGKFVAKGSWIVVSKVFDGDLWDEIKKGDIQAYSIYGTGKRKSVDL